MRSGPVYVKEPGLARSRADDELYCVRISVFRTRSSFGNSESR
jgi:hypothetical protein